MTDLEINDAFGKPMYETDPTNARHNSLQLQCYEQRKEIAMLKERIKRLESVENSHADVLNAIDNWIQQYKSEEAKP